MSRRLAYIVVRLAAAGLGLLAAGAVIRFALLHDRAVPARIAGGSMAPALLGSHYRIDCNDCRFPFSIDATSLPPEGYAVCPQCGYQGNEIANGRLVPGDPVLIDRAAWDVEHPRRWDLVAIRRPDEPGRLAVKRIVGLPGERIAIRDGEVYVDGRLLRKPLQAFHRMAVLVHDGDYRPPLERDLPRRWLPERPDNGWREVNRDENAAGSSDRGISLPAANNRAAESRDTTNQTGETHPPQLIYRYAATATADSPPDPDWLVYQHWPGLPPPSPRTQPSPVRDNYGYNQNVSRQLNDVRDLVLQLQLLMRNPGCLVLRYDDGTRRWEVSFGEAQPEPEQPPVGQGTSSAGVFQITLRFDGRMVAECNTPNVDWQQPHGIEFGLVDGRVIVAVDGQTRIAGYDPETVYSSPQRAVLQPFAIGAAGGEIEVCHLQILRDLYYLHGWQTAAPWEMDRALTDDQIFVLGDNCPIARDSRNWPRPGVPLSDVLGYVVPRPPTGE